MSWADLPSLNSLRAFASVAQTGSYSRAGADLNVSHAAVCQQVKALEARLGVTLLIREGRGLRLTDEGAALARQVAQGLTAIREGVEALTKADAARPIQVTMSPAFAVSWLMPRIMDFQHRHPEMTLMLSPTAQIVELRPGGIDLAIRYGEWHVARHEGRRRSCFPTWLLSGHARCSAGEKSPTSRALAKLPWLQELGTNEVAQWMARHGIVPKRPPMITHMPGNLIMEAVRRGDGLTYTARCFVEREIQSGQLVVLSSENNVGGYYIVMRPGVPRPPVRAFVRWLKQQVA
jgi:LysR family glycine cleavage system transcriptional activator